MPPKPVSEMPQTLRPLKYARIEQVPLVLASLTSQQKAAARVCVDYLKANDQLPSHEKLAALLGLKSPNAARHYFKVLERVGFLEPNEAGRFRFARVEGMSVFDVLKNDSVYAFLVGLHGLDAWACQIKPSNRGVQTKGVSNSAMS